VGGARFDVTRLGPILEDIHERMAGVIIECLPWREFIARYDGLDTLFYLDPPYWDSEDDYGDKFSKADFAGLATELSKIKGHFLLSVNDVPETRAFFDRFSIEEVTTRYSIGGGEGIEAEEIIIMGPSPETLRLSQNDLFGGMRASRAPWRAVLRVFWSEVYRKARQSLLRWRSPRTQAGGDRSLDVCGSGEQQRLF
jgi:hypothetical protein